MRWCIAAIFGLISTPPVAADADIRALCSERWPSDYVMQLDCVERQARAKARLGSIGDAPAIDGIWAGRSTADLAFLSLVKISGGEVTHASGATIKARRSISTHSSRMLTDLEWSDREKMSNRICGESPPQTIFLALDDDRGPSEMFALFYTEKAPENFEAFEQLGDPCDYVKLVRVKGDWGELTNPAPYVSALNICTERFGNEDTPELNRCVNLERDAIISTDEFLKMPTQLDAFKQCQRILRGFGSMDFNPRYVYLSCARAEGREDAIAACVSETGASLRDGVLTLDSNTAATFHAMRDCIMERLDILNPN